MLFEYKYDEESGQKLATPMRKHYLYVGFCLQQRTFVRTSAEPHLLPLLLCDFDFHRAVDDNANSELHCLFTRQVKMSERKAPATQILLRRARQSNQSLGAADNELTLNRNLSRLSLKRS